MCAHFPITLWVPVPLILYQPTELCVRVFPCFAFFARMAWHDMAGHRIARAHIQSEGRATGWAERRGRGGRRRVSTGVGSSVPFLRVTCQYACWSFSLAAACRCTLRASSRRILSSLASTSCRVSTASCSKNGRQKKKNRLCLWDVVSGMGLLSISLPSCFVPVIIPCFHCKKQKNGLVVGGKHRDPCLPACLSACLPI